MPSLQAINTVSDIATNGSGSYVLPYLDHIPVYDQEQLGSCSANANAFCFEYCQYKQNLASYNSQLPFTPPSRLFIYYNERNYEGSTANDAGAQLYDGIKSLNEIGACSSTLWPYDSPPPNPPPLWSIKFAQTPPQNCYTQASQNIALTYNAVQQPTTVVSQSMSAILQSISGIQAALVTGYPVAFGFTVFPFFQNEMYGSNFILQCPTNPVHMTTSVGGHAVVIVGYDNNFQTSNGNGAFLVRNSWNASWGVNYVNGSYDTGSGYFWMPYQYFTNQYTDTNGNIQTFTYDLWTINTVATNNFTIGSTGYGQLQFNSPNSVAVDLSGNYVIADTFNNRIQVVSPSGQFIRFIGSIGVDASGNPLYGSGNCQFYQPNGVAVDLSGNYVIVDTYNYRIQIISPLGVFIRQIGSYATGGNGNFNQALGIAVDLSGNYIVADSGNNLIQVISPLGIFKTQFTSYTNPSLSNIPINFNNPRAVAIDLSGNYVIADSGNNCIVVISPLGNFIRQFGSGGSTIGDGTLNSPTGVAVDLSGNYLVADSNNNLVQIFTPSGEFYSELGSVSLTSSDGYVPGPFSSPQGVAVDPNNGKYIVVDSVNNRILAFNV